MVSWLDLTCEAMRYGSRTHSENTGRAELRWWAGPRWVATRVQVRIHARVWGLYKGKTGRRLWAPHGIALTKQRGKWSHNGPLSLSHTQRATRRPFPPPEKQLIVRRKRTQSWEGKTQLSSFNHIPQRHILQLPEYRFKAHLWITNCGRRRCKAYRQRQRC